MCCCSPELHIWPTNSWISGTQLPTWEYVMRPEATKPPHGISVFILGSLLYLTNAQQRYISQYPAQFSLEVYNEDPIVREIVDKFVNTEAHQSRGRFCRVIFDDVIAGRPLDESSKRICFVLGASDVGDPIPKYIKAHLAQLRIIAHARIGVIKKTEEAVAASQAGNSTSAKGTKRARNDTGFWTAVNARFKDLVRLHTAEYDTDGWRQWEDEVIAADTALFVGEPEFLGEINYTFDDSLD